MDLREMVCLAVMLVAPACADEEPEEPAPIVEVDMEETKRLAVTESGVPIIAESPAGSFVTAANDITQPEPPPPQEPIPPPIEPPLPEPLPEPEPIPPPVKVGKGWGKGGRK